jgi:zinc transport system permease protein
MTFFEALFTNSLLAYALLGGLFASVASGIIGSYVVVKRIVFISGGISHSILGGIGFCLWLDRVHGIHFATPLIGALGAGILSAILIGWIHLNWKEREDTVIAALWSIGMAAGVIFISQTPGFNVELTNFLIGNILWVSPQDLKILGLLDLIIVLIVATQHKKFLALCFDEEQAKLQGIHVGPLYLLLLILTAMTIVLLIQVVGIILVMTMLTIPAAIANIFTTRLSRMMLLGILFSSLFCLFGTALAFTWDWPGGATIALVAGFAYVCSLFAGKGTKKAFSLLF